MEDVNTVTMLMLLNVIQHDPNDGLAIKEQNIISYAAYISKMLDSMHAMQPNILYTTVIMAQFANNPQENWLGVKRILRYLKGTMDFFTHL